MCEQVAKQSHKFVVVSGVAQLENAEVKLVNFLELCRCLSVQVKHLNDDLLGESFK